MSKKKSSNDKVSLLPLLGVVAVLIILAIGVSILFSKPTSDVIDKSHIDPNFPVAEAAEEGDKLPNFKLLKTDTYSSGPSNFEYITNEDLKGKNTIFMFYSTWCGYCQQEAPSIAELQKVAKEKYPNTTIYTVNMTPNEERFSHISTFINSYKLDNNYSLMDFDGTFAKQLGVTGTPTNVYVGPDGQIEFFAPGLLEDEYLFGIAQELEELHFKD